MIEILDIPTGIGNNSTWYRVKSKYFCNLAQPMVFYSKQISLYSSDG